MFVSSARSAFTRLELLVVTTIGVVVIALLLPAIQMVREQMAFTRCRDNVRQIGVAFHAFTAAHKDALPDLCSHKEGKSYTVFFSLLPYLGQETLYQDAMDNTTLATWTAQVPGYPTAPYSYLDDHGKVLVDQGVGPVLHLACRIPLGMDVGNFLEFQRAFEGNRVVNAPAQEKKIVDLLV